MSPAVRNKMAARRAALTRKRRNAWLGLLLNWIPRDLGTKVIEKCAGEANYCHRSVSVEEKCLHTVYNTNVSFQDDITKMSIT